MLTLISESTVTVSISVLRDYVRSYLLVDLADYFELGSSFYINLLILAVFLAFITVMAVTCFLRRNMYIAVKQLYRHGAGSEEGAKTLAEIGLLTNRTVRRFLSHDSQLTAVVSRVGAKRYTYEEYLAATKAGKLPDERIDFSTARFYLSPEKADRVKRILDGYNVGPVQALFYALLFLAIFVGVSIIVPDLLSYLAGLGV